MGISNLIAASLKKAHLCSESAFSSGTAASDINVNFVSDKLAIVSWRESSADIYARQVIIASDGSISFGATLTVYSSGSTSYLSSCYSKSAGKLVCVYGKVNSSYTGMFTKSISLSGTSLTASSESQIWSSVNQGIQNVISMYDPVGSCVHISYVRYNSGYKTYIRSLSGTNFTTVSTETRISTGTTYKVRMCYDTNSSKVIIAYTDATPNLYIVSASFSAGTYTFGTINSSYGVINKLNSLSFDDKRNKAVCVFYSNTGYGSVFSFYLSGTSIVLEKTFYVTSGYLYQSSTYHKQSSRTFIFSASTSNKSHYLVSSLAGGNLGLTKSRTNSIAIDVDTALDSFNGFILIASCTYSTTPKIRAIKIT